MSVKVRLRPLKSRGVFRLEVIDSRSPRDGRAIEQVGFNDRCTSPAVISVEVDKALHWLEKGAQPTVAAKSVLRKAGVLYKRHLLGGVKKGALTLQQVEEKFNAWKENVAQLVRASRERQIEEQNKIRESLLSQETIKKEKRQEAIDEKRKQQEDQLLKMAQDQAAAAEGPSPEEA